MWTWQGVAGDTENMLARKSPAPRIMLNSVSGVKIWKFLFMAKKRSGKCQKFCAAGIFDL